MTPDTKEPLGYGSSSMGRDKNHDQNSLSYIFLIFKAYEGEDTTRRNETISDYRKKLCRLLYNVRLTSEPQIGAEFA